MIVEIPSSTGFTSHGAPTNAPGTIASGPPIGNCEYQRPTSTTVSSPKNSRFGSTGSDNRPCSRIFACQSWAISSGVLADLSNAYRAKKTLSPVARGSDDRREDDRRRSREQPRRTTPGDRAPRRVSVRRGDDERGADDQAAEQPVVEHLAPGIDSPISANGRRTRPRGARR